jgi:protein-S-isoprenylcysteine O-methyltransferase Ste14
MTRRSAAIGSLVFLVLAPGIVAGLVPWSISRWTLAPPFAGYGALKVVGAALIVAGLIPLLDAFTRFAVEGEGTPAPVAPTKHLVVRGPYRFVRNPMYVGLLVLILGQALIFASLPLALYGAAIALAFHLFVTFYEEPTLRRTYGAEYEAFSAAVPRWLPRLTPWTPSQA